MAACGNCGEANPERARFCLACGSELGSPATQTRKTVSVLFADIVGSTALAEGMDPEAYRSLIQSRFLDIEGTIERYGGRVEKFIGDAIMAVFGVPTANEDDALRAVCAASAIQKELQASGRNDLAMRIAVNTGEVVTSGGEGRTGVVGDPVNTAARLEKMAPPGGVVIGGDTLRLVRDRVNCESLGPTELAGRSEPVDAYLLLAVDPIPPQERTYDAPMVGREWELQSLQHALDRVVRDETCMIVTILGPAGIGKSRLVTELFHRSTDAPRVLNGRCLPYGDGITFWPVTESVTQAAHISDRDSSEDAIEKVRLLVSSDEDSKLIAGVLSQLLGMAPATAGQEETFWAIRRFYEVLASEAPLVLVFDDIHWAEDTFLDLVDHLVENSSGVPMLIICMARPELHELRPSWGGGKLNSITMLIEPLREPETKDLLSGLLGDTSTIEPLLPAILEAAEGNPYFLEETIAMLAEDGVIEKTDGRWLARGNISEIAIPPTINALLTARLDRLPAPERGALELAAVMGKVFASQAVYDLAGGSASAETLGTLAKKGLIRLDQDEFAGEEMYRFRHLLIRDVMYQSIPKQRRTVVHEQYASWLIDVLGERVSEYDEIIGYHLEQAIVYARELDQKAEQDLVIRAGTILGRAARRAASRSDSSAAMNLFRRSLQLMPADNEQTPYLLLDLAEVMIDDGDFVRAEGVLGDALEAARALGDQVGEERARLALAECVIHTSAKTAADARSAAEASIQRFTELGDDFGLARAWRLLSYAFDTIGRSADSQQAMHRAVHHASLTGDVASERFYRRVQIRSLSWSPMPVSEIARLTREYLEWTRAHEDRKGESLGLGILAVTEASIGRFEEARELLRQQRRIYDELGLDLARAWGAFEVANVELMAGSLDAAETELRWSCEALRKREEKAVFPTVAAVLADVRCSQGDVTEAADLIAQANEVAVEDDLLTQIKCRSVTARIKARENQCDEALTIAREATTIAEETEYLDWRARAWVDLAEIADSCGSPSEANEGRRRALDLYEKKGMSVPAAELRQWLERSGA